MEERSDPSDEVPHLGKVTPDRSKLNPSAVRFFCWA
jgi:hypothetical protein